MDCPATPEAARKSGERKELNIGKMAGKEIVVPNF
jgi:hypothetical protein